jgi:hypothetical protein
VASWRPPNELEARVQIASRRLTTVCEALSRERSDILQSDFDALSAALQALDEALAILAELPVPPQ